ncbi:MAG: DUF3987 domain-containing protein [Desulfococcaceae bacterium]
MGILPPGTPEIKQNQPVSISGNLIPFEDILEKYGFQPVDRRGKTERHFPCPKCGGDDRLILTLSSGLAWCRQCNWGGDAIKFLREIQGMGFKEAVEALGGTVEGGNGGNGNGGKPPVRKKKSKSTPKPDEPPPIDRDKYWAAGTPVEGDEHSYLAGKGVKSYGLLRVDVKQNLMAPVYGPDGKLQTIERILPKKIKIGGKWINKLSLPGYPKKGGRLRIGKNLGTGPICVAEGYATAASVYESTGSQTYAVFSCSNFEPVIGNLRERYPDRDLIVCADIGNGHDVAWRVALKNGCRFVAPTFPEGADGTDFNDLHQSAGGAEAVKTQIEAAAVPTYSTHQKAVIDAIRRLAADCDGGKTADGRGFNRNDKDRGHRLAGIEYPTPAEILEAAEIVRHYPGQVGPAAIEATQSLLTDNIEWPDPIPLKSNIPDAPPFPTQCLPDAIAAYVSDMADRIQCRVDYPAVAAIIALTGSIGNTVRIRPKSRDNWEERPCLWGMAIGDPSENKSTPVRSVMSALKEIEADLAEDDKRRLEKYERELRAYQLRESAYKDQCKRSLKKDHGAEIPEFGVEPPEKPMPRRLILVDPSIEKAVELIAGSRGLTLYRDELSGWLLNMSRYSGGTDRQFYLTCYSGGPWVSDRITRAKSEAPDLYLNIIGTIQPEIARQIFSNAEPDGFFERFGLAVYPDSMCEWRYVDREPNHQAEAAFKMANRKLNAYDFGENPIARYDSHGQAAFIEWYSENRGKILQTDDPALKRARGKADGLVNRLALVLHLGAWATEEEPEPLKVSRNSFIRAAGLYEEYLFPMWKRIMAAFYSDGSENGAERILAWIIKEDIQEFSIRNIKRKCWAGLTDADKVEDAIEVLTENHFISELPKLPKGGRPAKRYAVNPKLKGS